MKKLFAVLVALTLVLSMGTIALAANGGSIEISNAVNGETYDAYRIFDLESFDAEKDNYSYKLSEKWAGFDKEAGISDYFIINELGYVEWKASDADNSDDVNAFVELAFDYAKKKSIAIDGTAVANNNTATISNLTLGYYLVDTSLGTLCAITTTKPDASVTDKNGEPSIVKKIDENGTLVDANNVAIGDTVNYQATVTAGNGTVNYVIHDTFSAGLDFDATSVVVKNTTDNYTLVPGTDYVLRTGDDTCGCTFEIDLTPAYEENKLSEGEEIVVTYSATLNEDAVIGSTGNPNEIYLTYGNDQETTKDTVITYTTKLTIDKVDANGDALEGAGFTLYKGTGDDKVAIGNEISGVTEFVWEGLAEGTYTLVETTVPGGYNKAADIVFTIECDEPDEVKTDADKATWSTTSDKIAAVNASVFEGEVVNNTGTLLPETGGIGTTIFYVVGGLLMAAAFILLVSKKRMATFA